MTPDNRFSSAYPSWGQGGYVAEPLDLRDIAARTHGQLMDLAREPSRDRCDRMISALADVSAQVVRLRAALDRQSK